MITLGTFHYLSWDIMEPVSYLMMLGNFTCGFGFYALMKKDLDLESVTDILVYRMTESAARRKGIDFAKHETARE